MAQIGSFTRDDAGAFTGTIRTLCLNVEATIKPSHKDNDKAPDYRITANGGVEFGAGWTKISRDDRPMSPSRSTIRLSPRRSMRRWSKARMDCTI